MIVLHIVSSIHYMEMEIQEKFEGDTNAYMKLKWNWCNYVQLFKVHMRSRTENPIESIVRNGDLTSIMDVRSSHEANPTIQATSTNAGSWQPAKTWNPPNCAMDLFSANQGSQVCIHPLQIPRSKPARPYALHQRPTGGESAGNIQKMPKTYKNTQKHLKNVKKIHKKLHSSIFAIEKLTCSVPNLQNSIAFVAASPVLAST